MTEEAFLKQIYRIKEVEKRGDFEECQRQYAQLSGAGLTDNQLIVVKLGVATCFLIQEEPRAALATLNIALDETVISKTSLALISGSRAQALHTLRRYSEAKDEAQLMFGFASEAGDDELAKEALARQAFAYAELGETGICLKLLNETGSVADIQLANSIAA